MLCDARTFAPRLVVDLNDASHDRDDRQARDAFVDEVLTGVGLPILHIRWQRQYDASTLGRQLRGALGLPEPGAAPIAATPAEAFWRPIPLDPPAALRQRPATLIS